MSNLEVMFHVPDQIALGLASGSLQRVGGVVRDSSSKQVVAWLRDGTAQLVVDDNVLPTSLSSILSATGSQVNLNNILSAFAVGGQVLNLAVTAVSFQVMMQRLERLSKELTNVIGSEFARERDMQFRVALQAARDVFEGVNASNRDNAMRSAVDGLFAARENFRDDFTRIMNQSLTTETLNRAQHLLIRAMCAEASRIKCYLVGEDVDFARQRLNEDIPLFAQHTRHLVNQLMGDHPAIYLHKLVGTEDVKRFLWIQQWLRLDDALNAPQSEDTLMQIINELRVDFWNADLASLIEEDNSFAKVSGQVIGDLVGRIGLSAKNSGESEGNARRLIKRLEYAEIAIENYERLLGFDLELRSFRLASGNQSFQEWGRLVSEEDLTEHGISIIVDKDRLARLVA